MNLENRVNKLLHEGYEFKLEQYFTRGYEIFKKEYGIFIGFSIIAGLIGIVASLIPVIGSVAQVIIGSITNLGFYYVARKMKKGENPEFGDFFQPFNAFGNIISTALLVFLLTLAGILCLVIPGIYLALAYSFAVPIIYFYKEIGVWDSMEASRRVITKNWWWFLLLGICIVFFNLLGALCLLVGLFITIPISHLIMYAAFDDIMDPDGDKVADEEKPPSIEKINE